MISVLLLESFIWPILPPLEWNKRISQSNLYSRRFFELLYKSLFLSFLFLFFSFTTVCCTFFNLLIEWFSSCFAHKGVLCYMLILIQDLKQGFTLCSSRMFMPFHRLVVVAFCLGILTFVWMSYFCNIINFHLVSHITEKVYLLVYVPIYQY